MYLLFIGIIQSNGQENNTQFVNDNASHLNIKLRDRVKYIKEVTENKVPENKEEVEYFFNENGQPIKIIETSLGIDVLARNLRKERTVFEFKNGILISELNEIDAGLDGYLFELDENGKLTSKISYVKNKIVAEESYEYDNEDRLAKVVKYSYGYFSDYNSESESDKSKYISLIETFEYDNAGNKVLETMNNIKGSIYKKYIYKYDINGNLIEEGKCKNYKNIDDTDSCEYSPLMGWKYNSKNQLTKKFQIAKFSPHNTDTYYYYDNSGNQTEIKGYYIKKDTTLGYHYRYDYDKHGNKIKEQEIVGNFRSIGSVNYKTQVLKFDEFKNIISEEYFDSNSMTVKVVINNYSYDNKGNWLKLEVKEGKTNEELTITEVKERLIEYY